MKFDYPEIQTTEAFNLRWYLINDELEFPSITSMLGATQSLEKKASLESWYKSLGKEKAEHITQEAADHGTSVHLLIEKSLKGEEINFEEFSEKNINAFKSVKLYLKRIDEVWGQEVALFSKELRIAGRCDCVGTYKGIPSIIDFKTSIRVKTEDRIEDYKYQLAFYAQAHNEMFGTNITNGVIIMATNGGFPLEFYVDLNKYFIKLKNRVEAFYEKLLG